MSTAKEKEIISNMIELYKDMPYLWCKNDKNYLNKNIRNEGYKVLLSVYKNIDENATIKTVKKKIDNLKTNYQREYKKVKASKHTGAGNEDVYVPSIWYYDSFSFLETTTESCRSITQTEEDENSSFSCTEDTPAIVGMANSPIRTYTSNENIFKKRRKEAPIKLQQDLLEKAAGLLMAKEEDWELVGRSIGVQLRDLNQQQLIVARKLISDVIFYGTLNKLTEKSCIILNVSTSSECNLESAFPHTTSSPYHQSLNSTDHTLPIPNHFTSPHPKPSTSHHSHSLNSPIYILPPSLQSPSPQHSPIASQSSNSQISHTDTLPFRQELQNSTQIQLHIPSPPSETIVFEGSGDIMKDFLFFKKI